MTRPLRKPLVDLIEDVNVRESLSWLYEYLIQVPLLRGQFDFFEVQIFSTGVEEKVPHKLGFVPKDIIVTSVTNSATVTFKYDKFDITNVVLQASAPCVVRFLAGRYDV
jgi:hypothetical protein